MNFITAPLQYEFFIHGLIAASLVGGICGLIGVYIVLRRMSYIGHGLSHAVFGGAVVSSVMNWNFYLGAGLWGFFSVILINYVARKKKIGADAAIGVITTASFAVGVAIISQYRRFTKNFEAVLFGNILGVTSEDLWMIAIVAFVSALLIFVFYRQLLFTTFDADVARIYGVPVGWTETLFSLILAAVIIVSMQVMGVTMIAAAIVIPAVVARLITDSFNKIVFLSVLIGVFCGIFGMYLSFHLNISSGATIVLVGAAIFVLTYVVQSLREKILLPKEGTVPAPLDTIPTHQHPHEHAGFFHVHEHSNHEKDSPEGR
ncbi:MAG: metal ABC transporter permease [Nitrospira sp.]|nr:metal ABC transporter permease [Candidatus Manganitrophaceae bacterium]HIL35240.1 metal ABC transporter permease [Candidatus Manganitrophaceae bacterium]